jgi:hypothetical protein
VSLAALMGAVSALPSFFRAHEALKKLTVQEKLVRMNSFRTAGRAMAGPFVTFAAAGAAYGAVECLTQDYLGREDTLQGVMGGLAVGTVIGLKRGSLIQGIGFGALCAGAMLVTDFFTCVCVGRGWEWWDRLFVVAELPPLMSHLPYSHDHHNPLFPHIACPTSQQGGRAPLPRHQALWAQARAGAA